MKILMDVKTKKINSGTTSLNTTRHGISKRNEHGSPEADDIVNETDMSNMMNDKGGTTYFEIMTEFCFFENIDTNYKHISQGGVNRAIDDRQEYNQTNLPQLDFRGPMDMHELFIDKL